MRRTYQLFTYAGDYKYSLRVDTNGWIRRRERPGVVKVHSGILAVEESRLGQHKDSRAGGAKHGPAIVHPMEPLDEAWVTPFLPTLRPQQHRRNDHDVTRRDSVDRALHVDRDAARQL